MRTSDLKDKIIKKVGEINDPAVLSDVMNLLELESKLLVHLSETEKAFVKVGLNDIEAGNTISHEDVMKDPKKWLEK